MEEIKAFLENEPKARERKNKNRCIARIIEKRHDTCQIGMNILLDTEIVKEILHLDREWRRCLQMYPYLRGNDYDDKTRLENEKMAQLGY